MKKYMFKRIMFSIFSLLVVVMAVMLLVYSLIERSVVFQTDDTWNKKSNNDRSLYEYIQYEKYGYLEYEEYTAFLKEKYLAIYGEEYYLQEDFVKDKAVVQKPEEIQENASVQEFMAKYGSKGYSIKYLAPITFKNGKVKPGGTGYLFATLEKNPLLRLVDYVKGFFTIETTKDVQDPNLTDRYVRFEKDPYNGAFALVGSGTQHKYLLYFDSHFPFMHWNWIHINLGTSFTSYRGQEITNVVTTPTGDLYTRTLQYPAMLGTDEYVETAIDFHTLTYNTNEISDVEKTQFPDNYTVYSYRRKGMSMVETSFVIGIIATILAYLWGLPLGVAMARHKDGFGDKLGNAYIVFIMSVPSLAYIFMFAAVGTKVFGLPYKFANAEIRILAYVLPVFSLTLPSMGGLMKWMRRYMIDQMNSDYVKFARAEGMSEKEIYRIHIMRNAVIFIVHGIPGSILGCITGALVTERAYSVPGVGNLLMAAINSHDNGIIVACTVIITAISLISLILGDLLLAKVDPRISLSEEGGGGR